jgi:vacuolar-type H+-ATPase subunit E/Vma4
VVEQVMAVSPVLPVKFGAIYRTQTSIKQFLEKHHNDIEQALERLRDKAEWSVKGYLVEAEARRIIEATDPAVQAKMATLSSSPGARYLQQKQLKATIESALDARMALVANELQQALAAHAVDSSSLRLHASSVTGRSERMVFNGGFLLNSEALTDFQAALSEQQDIYKDIDLKLELRGPWPPYNFCPNLSAEQT